MRNGEKASATFPLLVIFGVLMASLMAFVFISIYEQQMVARVHEEAKSLVDGLAKTAVQSLVEGELLPFDLPSSVGGSSYILRVVDNNTFEVMITAGRGAGDTHASVVGAHLLVENSDFTPGGRVYFLRRGDYLVVSASEIQKPLEIAPITPPAEPPHFYHFAKENVREAVGIAAAYFHFRSKHPEVMVDATAYEWENGNLLVQLSEDENPVVAYQIYWTENLVPVGKVERYWVVSQVENTGLLEEGKSCPSVKEAHQSGWYYSPAAVLDHLRSRTWRRIFDNRIISIPADAEISAAAATTNVSTYPTWRVSFDAQVIIYRGMPWWELENTPGFVFQSDPELHPVI